MMEWKFSFNWNYNEILVARQIKILSKSCPNYRCDRRLGKILCNRFFLFNVPAEIDKKTNKLENAGTRYEDLPRKLITLENIVTIRNGFLENGCGHRLPASCLHCARSIPEQWILRNIFRLVQPWKSPTVIIFNRAHSILQHLLFSLGADPSNTRWSLLFRKKKFLVDYIERKQKKPVPLPNVPPWISTLSKDRTFFHTYHSFFAS